MAQKHMVKCSICNLTFDANSTPFVKTHNGRRYAHESCYEHREELKTPEQKDFEQLEAYLKQLFQVEKLNARTFQLLTQYVNEYHYTYNGILKAVKFFYEIKKNDISKSNNSIGIVPFCYDDAQRYYYSLWEAQQKNSLKVIEEYKPEVEEIKIAPPERKIVKRKLFSFLDEE